MDSSVLIQQCNEFLDGLSNFGDNFKKPFLEKENSVNELQKSLECNLCILENLREKMELQGFETPYIGVGQIKGGEDDDIYEIINYSSYLRRMVDEKKGSLERAKYAIVSHKIAIGNLLDEFGNKDILQNLPYNGSYKEHLSKIPPLFFKSYKNILSAFESEGFSKLRSSKIKGLEHAYPEKGVVSSITLSLVIIENGKRKFKRVKIEEEDYEGYIKRTYGDAIITSVKKNYSKNKLLNDQYVKKTLTLAYFTTYLPEIKEKINLEVKESLSKEERCLIKKYSNICENFENDVYEGGIIDVRALEETKLKKMNIKTDLEEKGLYKNGKLLENLKKSLEIQNRIFESISVEIPIKKISKDLFMYYLLKSPDERSRSHMFSSILVTPSTSQLKWLDIEEIEPKKILDLKFMFEKELPKYEISLKNIGGVSIYLLYGMEKALEYGFEKTGIEDILKLIAVIEDIKENLKGKIDLKVLEKYCKIKKEKTKSFLNALGKL
ncbi:Protein of unknown function DUF530 [Methanococcus vannielii SB]|uniref:Uncharacterized protein n=1 Tax=Methanococcus vannielii (strain ATCC 35089 / DSM 1224 / JCM 13029 / OCM 148 / SB) TaxID=406327 RepID=A6UNS6_METVS|nr:DUF530 family protein [Methanococcus vannielii]ABR54148.1 Protein of unknown function DUF530 [Methanococcus vannielii SB]